MDRFVNLHSHTIFSMGDSISKLPDLIDRVTELDQHAIAMTDHGNLAGAVQFTQECKEASIKPIIGMEAYVTLDNPYCYVNDTLHYSSKPGLLTDENKKLTRYHVTLLAKNEQGYRNLSYLSSMGYMYGFFMRPRIKLEDIFEKHEGLIFMTGCRLGLVYNAAVEVIKSKKAPKPLMNMIKKAKEVFGDDFYLEIMRHGIGDQHFIDEPLLQIAKETGIKLVATNDTHYTYNDDAQYHEAFMSIGMGKLYDDPNRMRHSVHEFYLKSPEQMEKLFADIPEALIHTQEIVDKCNLELDLGNPTPPNF